MTAAGFSALLSYWWRTPLQLFTLIAGLALATALWSGVQALNSEARASYDAAAATLGEGRFDQLVPRIGEHIPQGTYLALRRAGWLVGPVLEGTLRLEGERVRLVGIDPLTAPGGAGPLTRAGEMPLITFLDEGVIFANPEVAEALDAALEPRIVADPGLAPGTALTDIGVAQALLERPGLLTRLILAEAQPLGRAPLEEVAPELILRPSQQSSDIGQLTDSFHLNLTAFGLLSFAVGIFIVHSAIGLAFEQRRGMVRSLRAMGFPLNRLIALMAAELALIALIAGGLGVLLGYLLAARLMPDVAATLEGLYGAQISGALRLNPSWWLSGLAMALLGTALAASAAFWRLAKMPVLAAGARRAWVVASGERQRLLALASAALLTAATGLAAACLMFHAGLIAGFASLACLLIGAALALPLLLRGVLGVAEGRAREALWQWFWADTRQQIPGLSLALMALLLAMAANVGVSTMVSSFRLTFTGFLDQRLTAEIYVATESAEQSAALEAYAAEKARAVLPIQWVESRVAGQRAEVYGARVGPSYEENWRFLASEGDVWARVDRGEAAIINEQLARRAGLWPGDSLPLTPGMSLPIAGVVGDYGNPIGQVVLSEALFQRLFPGTTATRFGLRTQDASALRAGLIDELGLDPGQITDQAAIKAFSIEVFERTFTVTAALNVLTLGVAGFAILMSLLTLARMRLPQLAPAWALGLTRQRLARLELLRAVILAAITLMAALPLGLALAWILLAIVNVEAFGWRLPMFLFPADYTKLGALALTAAALAATWPALKLARTPPAALLKVFANDA